MHKGVLGIISKNAQICAYPGEKTLMEKRKLRNLPKP